MRLGPNFLALAALSMIGLMVTPLITGCKSSGTQAKAPEADPWADYKGTYAGGGPAIDTKPAKSPDVPPTPVPVTLPPSEPSASTGAAQTNEPAATKAPKKRAAGAGKKTSKKLPVKK